MNPATGRPWETVTLTTLSHYRSIFPKLLLEARDLALTAQEGRLLIYTHWHSEWRAFGPPRLKRPLSSVVLDDGVSEIIEADVKHFLARKQWYAKRGALPPYDIIAFSFASQEYLGDVDICCMALLGVERPRISRRWQDPLAMTYTL